MGSACQARPREIKNWWPSRDDSGKKRISKLGFPNLILAQGKRISAKYCLREVRSSCYLVHGAPFQARLAQTPHTPTSKCPTISRSKPERARLKQVQVVLLTALFDFQQAREEVQPDEQKYYNIQVTFIVLTPQNLFYHSSMAVRKPFPNAQQGGVIIRSLLKSGTPQVPREEAMNRTCDLSKARSHLSTCPAYKPSKRGR